MPLTDQADRRLMLLGILLLGLAISVMVYYWITVPDEDSFGERYVNSEVPLIFPFFVIMSFKPITLTVYLIFTGVLLILEAIKERLRDRNTRPIKIMLLLIAFASGYEVFWNFFAWFTVWQREGGVLDAIANTTHEYPILPANFNFATKIVFLIFALSLYGSLFLGKLERSKPTAH